MNTKIVSQLNDDGYFVGPTVADESPLEPGVFHIPRGCVDVPPPQVEEGKVARWTEQGWQFDDMPDAPQPTQAELPLQERVIQAVQLRLDAFARSRFYDGILSACTYATSNVPKFSAEAAYCVQARDAHWAACYAILDEVQAGTRDVPTVAEVLAEMPELAWPDAPEEQAPQ